MQKTFDCVKMMREIRSELSKRYAEHPETFEEDMTRVRRKYGFPQPERKSKPFLVAEETAAYGQVKTKDRPDPRQTKVNQ